MQNEWKLLYINLIYFHLVFDHLHPDLKTFSSHVTDDLVLVPELGQSSQQVRPHLSTVLLHLVLFYCLRAIYSIQFQVLWTSINDLIQ